MADISSNLYSWSTTAASNNPAGTTTIGSGLDDNLREIQKVVRTDLAFYNSSAVASAGTVDLGAQTGNFLDISGTTTITAFGTVAAGIWKVIRFQGALTLTHNATSLILPSAANITTAANDRAFMYSLGNGNWVCAMYETASGRSLVATDLSTFSAETSPATDDTLAIYDTSEGANNKMTFANFFKVITSLTAETSVATSDEVPIYDASEGAANKATLANVMVPFTASQADMEAASSTTTFAPPGRFIYSPFAAKAWVMTDYTAAAAVAANISSVTDNGTGDLTINFSTAFSTGSFCAVATVDDALQLFAHVSAKTTGSVRVLTKLSNTAALADGDYLNVVCFGDL